MNYMKITKHDIANGEGIRVVLWCSGCTLHCKECQNPQTWDFNAGKPFDDTAKQELFEALDHPWIQGLMMSLKTGRISKAVINLLRNAITLLKVLRNIT